MSVVQPPCLWYFVIAAREDHDGMIFSLYFSASNMIAFQQDRSPISAEMMVEVQGVGETCSEKNAPLIPSPAVKHHCTQGVLQNHLQSTHCSYQTCFQESGCSFQKRKIPVSGNHDHHSLMMLNVRHHSGSEAWLKQGGLAGQVALQKANSSLFQTTMPLFHKRFLSSSIITENSPLFSGPSHPLHRTQRG